MRAIHTPDKDAPETVADSQYVNLSGYRFIWLNYLPVLQADLHSALAQTGVKGTILLADEGINVALAGTASQCEAARKVLNADERLRDLWLKESISEVLPFSKLKVRIRHEIIAFDGPDAGDRQLHRMQAPALAPETVASWIDSDKDFTLLDTRNTYEVESGTFGTARHLDIGHFRDFQQAVAKGLSEGSLDLEKPVVTFCTGGIRCEKAAPWMLEQGFKEVYQIEGGVLNYFERTGGKHWNGDCFVFDDRVEVDTMLQPTGATWCTHCQLTIQPGEVCRCQLSSTADEIV